MPRILKRLAAVDLGTNSFHLVIVEADPATGRFNILVREKEIVRLGSGSSDMKRLSAAAMRRGLRVLTRFRNLADAAGAPLRAVATSAVREARNRDVFLEKVRAETGVRVEIASGAEEARLIHLGVLQALPIFRRRVLLVDIGGGSTEFLVGRGRRIQYSNSLKIGTVRLTERFFSDGTAGKKRVEECREFLRGSLSPVAREIASLSVDLVVGSSGTILNVARMIRGMRDGGDARRGGAATTNAAVIRRDDLQALVRRVLSARTARERGRIPGLDRGRADLIVAGVLILSEVLSELHIDRMTVSDYALREGVIFDTLEKAARDRAPRLGQIRSSSVRHLLRNFGCDRTHAQHVARLALSLFDQTHDLHRLGEPHREYLEASALLHDAGLFVSHAQHHLHSYYLIRNSELLGFTEDEKEIIASVARYHRKSHPRSRHDGFGSLSAADREVVGRLAGILRIADGLDRTHSRRVGSVTCAARAGRLLVRVRPSGSAPIDLEIWSAERKKGLFESAYGLDVKLATSRRAGCASRRREACRERARSFSYS